MKCSICKKDIPPENGWTSGHNAEPATSGRCCAECNAFIVTPMRLAPVYGAKKAVAVSLGISNMNMKGNAT